MIRDDISDCNPLDGYWMEGDSLAPPCQTDDDVIDAILQLANLSHDSYLLDLGCGDGRICIAASQRYGCRSCGVEIEENLIADFRRNIETTRLSNLTCAVQGDLTEFNCSDATVIVLYLLPESIELIKSKLFAALDRGATLICHTWGPKGIVPQKRVYCGQWNNVSLHFYTKDSLYTIDKDPILPAAVTDGL